MYPSVKIPAKLFHATPFHIMGLTGKNITVAILDSGISYHPDITANRILAFADFTSQHIATSPYDDFSHGTHVTGILASSRIGIAPECNIVSLKVLDKYGNGNSSQFIDALKWLYFNHDKFEIKIVNISIGGSNHNLKQQDAPINRWVQKLWDSGLIICCSAGNNGPKPNTITAPGNCHKIITVGASDGIPFSSTGPRLPYITKPELVAPGNHILSLKPGGGYQQKSGTSMAVPFISGACALLLQKNTQLTNTQMKRKLMDASIPLPHVPYNVQGAGIVSLKKLLH